MMIPHGRSVGRWFNPRFLARGVSLWPPEVPGGPPEIKASPQTQGHGHGFCSRRSIALNGCVLVMAGRGGSSASWQQLAKIGRLAEVPLEI